MDYKEKYEMALERAKCLYSQHEVEWRDEDIEYIFPELKKSEDERIRKELITHCRNTRCVTEEGAERIAKWLAWLKKQGEKPADKKEPKFKKSIFQFVINKGCQLWHICRDRSVYKPCKDYKL